MNTADHPVTRDVRQRALLIGTVLLVSYAYFYQGGGWNQNSRFDLVRAMVEQRTLRIDDYQDNTGDKAVYQGHYYSDKAPGLALLALPAVAVARPILRAAGVDPLSPSGLVALSYIATLFAVALPAALGCACMMLLAARLGSGIGGAFAALGLGLGTPLWAWATLFWGHALAGSCLLLSLAAIVALKHDPGRPVLWSFAAGLAAGWATVSEYPAAPASAVLALLMLSVIRSSDRQRQRRAVGGFAVGTLVCVGVLTGYQYLAFGSVLHLGYAYYEPGAFPWMSRGFVGLTYPRIDVMWKLLFGWRRGLLFAAPVVAAAPFGLRLLWKETEHRGVALAAAAIAAYYFLFNASFSAWHGAWSYGPRYMGAGVPVLCVGLAQAWSRASSRWRWGLGLLAMFGAMSALMAVSVTAQPPSEFRCPLVQLYWPLFWAGRLSYNQGSFLRLSEELPGQTHGAFNLGELMGLHGLWSLLPLLAVWVLAAWAWKRLDREDHRGFAKSAAT